MDPKLITKENMYLGNHWPVWRNKYQLFQKVINEAGLHTYENPVTEWKPRTKRPRRHLWQRWKDRVDKDLEELGINKGKKSMRPMVVGAMSLKVLKNANEEEE